MTNFVFRVEGNGAPLKTVQEAQREISRLLVLTANRMKEGYSSGTLTDHNGNTVASWTFKFGDENGTV